MKPYLQIFTLIRAFNYQKPMRIYTKIPVYLLLLLLLVSACKEQAFDEHYERPDWLRGNAWKVLEEKGNYSIFLDAVEKAGFRSLVEGKGIVTVIAPDNNSMEYLWVGTFDNQIWKIIHNWQVKLFFYPENQ